MEALILIRALFLSIMIWLIMKDIETKGTLHVQYYTVWGEIATCAVFFLLFLCSVEKYLM
jgi:hypothetical protein